jgi:hypothetical protein
MKDTKEQIELLKFIKHKQNGQFIDYFNEIKGNKDKAKKSLMVNQSVMRRKKNNEKDQEWRTKIDEFGLLA